MIYVKFRRSNIDIILIYEHFRVKKFCEVYWAEGSSGNDIDQHALRHSKQHSTQIHPNMTFPLVP